MPVKRQELGVWPACRAGDGLLSTMTPKRKRQRGKSRAKEQHEQLVAALELADSCCGVCHCDCYSSHSSSNASGRGHGHSSAKTESHLKQLDLQIRALEQVQRSEHSLNRDSSRARSQSALKSPSEQPKTAHSRRGSAECQTRVSTASRGRRSKSAGSQRSQSRQEHLELRLQAKPSKQRAGRTTAVRDCQMLQVSVTQRTKSEDKGLTPLTCLSVSSRRLQYPFHFT